MKKKSPHINGLVLGCFLISVFGLIVTTPALQAADTVSFATAQQYDAGGCPNSVAIGDLNGDGK